MKSKTKKKMFRKLKISQIKKLFFYISKIFNISSWEKHILIQAQVKNIFFSLKIKKSFKSKTSHPSPAKTNKHKLIFEGNECLRIYPKIYIISNYLVQFWSIYGSLERVQNKLIKHFSYFYFFFICLYIYI